MNSVQVSKDDVTIVRAPRENPHEITLAASNTLTETGGASIERQVFTTASEHLKNQRKRTMNASASDGQPPVKKTEPTKNAGNLNNAKTMKDERCLTGNVSEIIKFNKDHPDLNAFYEVYGKIFKVTAKEHQKILLLRNDSDSGPILQAIFSEIDIKMDDLKAGDSVRVVGRFKSRSFLNVFKIRVSDDNTSAYVRRLNSIGSFALKKFQK